MTQKKKNIEDKFLGAKFVGNLPDTKLYTYNGKCYRVPCRIIFDVGIKDYHFFTDARKFKSLDGYETTEESFIMIDKIRALYKDDYESVLRKINEVEKISSGFLAKNPDIIRTALRNAWFSKANDIYKARIQQKVSLKNDDIVYMGEDEWYAEDMPKHAEDMPKHAEVEDDEEYHGVENDGSCSYEDSTEIQCLPNGQKLVKFTVGAKILYVVKDSSYVLKKVTEVVNNLTVDRINRMVEVKKLKDANWTVGQIAALKKVSVDTIWGDFRMLKQFKKYMRGLPENYKVIYKKLISGVVRIPKNVTIGRINRMIEEAELRDAGYLIKEIAAHERMSEVNVTVDLADFDEIKKA